MKITATKDFSSTAYGYITAGSTFEIGTDVSERFARHMVDHGLGEMSGYDTKVVRDEPAPVRKPRRKSEESQ